MVEVSVLIPNRNYSKFLGSCIESVLNQTHKDYEIIVCDDNSTDNSLEIIKEYPKVNTIIKRDGKPSIPSCRNELLKKSNGKYIAYLSSDDYWHPTFLEVMLNAIKSNGVSSVYCDMKIIDSEGNPTGEKKTYPSFPTKDALHGRCSIPECCIGFSASVISKCVFNDIGPFDEAILHGEETEWAIRATKYHYFFHVDEDLVFKRVHQNNMGIVYRYNQSVAAHWASIMKKHAQEWIQKREKERKQ